MLKTIETVEDISMLNLEMYIDEEINGDSSAYRSPFMSQHPKMMCELQIIKKKLQLEDDASNFINWPVIDFFLVNEYNIEGLLDMSFPTLFPKGSTLYMQPNIEEIKAHEFAHHLMRFHDNQFGRHPYF